MKEELISKIIIHLLETSQVRTVKEAMIRQKIIDEYKNDLLSMNTEQGEKS